MTGNINKMVDSKDKVQDKVEVDPNSRVEMSEDCYKDLASLKEDLEELEKVRKELGRLTQQVHNLVSICNNKEDSARAKRKQLTERAGLDGGKWVVDFENRAFFKVLPGVPRTV